MHSMVKLQGICSKTLVAFFYFFFLESGLRMCKEPLSNVNSISSVVCKTGVDVFRYLPSLNEMNLYNFGRRTAFNTILEMLGHSNTE